VPFAVLKWYLAPEIACRTFVKNGAADAIKVA
jgi:hypothetical protein